MFTICRLKQDTKLFSVFISMFFGFLSLTLADINLPQVIKTDPEHLSTDVYPIRYIHFWLHDVSFIDNVNSSHIILESIVLFVNGESKDLTIQFQGKDKIWAYTSEMQNLPENAEITSIIMAEDSDGNRMTPYVFQFYTAKLPDQKPPIIYNISPEDQSTDNVRFPLISCAIEDVGTGVDLNSLLFVVDGFELSYTFSEIENGYEIYAFPPLHFLYEQWVNVSVSVTDYAKNSSKCNWTFRIRSKPPKTPNLFYPSHGTLMNYQKEEGTIRFVWQLEKPEHSFRLRIKPSDGPIAYVFDLDPGEYWSTENFAGYNFHLSFNLWYQYSCKESLDWSVAVIDKKEGVPISPFSPWSSIVLAPPNAVVLRSPDSGSSFGFKQQPPVFMWDKFNDAESYMLGIAKLDYATGFFQNLYTTTLQVNVNSYQMTNYEWRSLGPGLFIWAVIATDKNGNLSDFMNYEFNILSPVIINQSLSIY